MKIIGRVLIILAVFSALSGLMVLAVNASGTNSPDFTGAPQQFRPEGDGGGDFVRPEGNAPNFEGRQDRPERGERGGSRWMFGLVKNMGVMAVLVTLIALPKNIAKKKRKQAAVNSANGGA
jgi:hypothetical protein